MGIAALVPRKNARIVLCDDGDGVAERGVKRLNAIGYSDVSVLAGGNPAWAAALDRPGGLRNSRKGITSVKYWAGCTGDISGDVEARPVLDRNPGPVCAARRLSGAPKI